MTATPGHWPQGRTFTASEVEDDLPVAQVVVTRMRLFSEMVGKF